MITSSIEPSINKSVINRHSYISNHRKVQSKQIPSKPVEKHIVKRKPKIMDTKSAIKKESIRQEIIDEIKPIGKQLKQELTNIDSMEEAIHAAVNDSHKDHKTMVTHHNTPNVTDNRPSNTPNQYAYNSILGKRVYYN